MKLIKVCYFLTFLLVGFLGNIFSSPFEVISAVSNINDKSLSAYRTQNKINKKAEKIVLKKFNLNNTSNFSSKSFLKFFELKLSTQKFFMPNSSFEKTESASADLIMDPTKWGSFFISNCKLFSKKININFLENNRNDSNGNIIIIISQSRSKFIFESKQSTYYSSKKLISHKLEFLASNVFKFTCDDIRTSIQGHRDNMNIVLYELPYIEFV